MALQFIDDASITGTLTTGEAITSGGSITMPDWIYHTGDSDSFFGFGNGANTFGVETAGTAKFAADATSAYVYYDNSQRLKTTSAGAEIYGIYSFGTNSSSWRITNCSNPQSAQDVATKAYVDAHPAGTVTSVTATAPILSTGGTTPVISAKLVNVSGNWWNGGLVQVATDGVAEVGKYIDMHAADAATSDFDVRLTATTGTLTLTGNLTVSLGNISLGGTGRITGIDTVSASTDAVNKAYADARAGTVESVGFSHAGNAFTTGGAPITSSGTIAITMAGNSNQYILGDGDLKTFPSIPQGDITNVTAGDGLSGGGSTGSISLAVDSTVVRTSGSQSISGFKSLQNTLTLNADLDMEGGGDLLLAADGRISIDGDYGSSGQVLTSTGSLQEWQTPSGGISGSGVSGRVPIFNGTSSLTSDSAFAFNTGTNVFTASKIAYTPVQQFMGFSTFPFGAVPGNTIKIIGLSSNAGTTNVSSPNPAGYYIAPQDGRVKQVVIRNVKDTPVSRSTRIKIYKNGANTFTSSYLSGSGTNSVGWYVDFDDINHDFSQYDRVQLAFQGSSSATDWKSFVVTVIWQFEDYEY